MKPAIALLVGLVLNGAVSGAELTGLKVLYVGSERSSEFVEFLKGKVATVEARSRESFQPRDAARFDVVLFDWPQGEETREMRKLKSPLGTREGWNKPTVLLGKRGPEPRGLLEAERRLRLHLSRSARLRPAGSRDLRAALPD